MLGSCFEYPWSDKSLSPATGQKDVECDPRHWRSATSLMQLLQKDLLVSSYVFSFCEVILVYAGLPSPLHSCPFLVLNIQGPPLERAESDTDLGRLISTSHFVGSISVSHHCSPAEWDVSISNIPALVAWLPI